MSLLNLFKLEKLTIEAYLDAGRHDKADPPEMAVMFNPSSYQRSHEVIYNSRRLQGINTEGQPARYALSAPGELKLKLVLDGTGVNQYGAELLFDPPSVKADIDKFERLCVRMNGDIHQPNFLVVRWGDLRFPGRLKTLNISYTLFDESGDPLRAELDVHFIEDRSTLSIAKRSGKSSPDLTHVRIAKAGDTLPLLCQAIYGSSRHYLLVARHNGMDDFRQLQPGQRIQFPPLPVEASGASGASS